MKFFKPTLLLATGVLIGAALTLKINVVAKTASQQNIPLAGLRTFSQIFRNIKNDYVEEISDKDLINNAIAGMVGGLDPHSSYLLPDDFKDLTINTIGKFGGLGIEISMQDGFVKIVSPIDDTPAKKAGVEAGDLIIRIDDKSVQGMTIGDAIKLMRGKVGTPIEITIVREGKDKPFVIKMIRDTIKIRSVKSKLLEPKFGYVRISQFQSKTKQNLKAEINKLVKQNQGGKLKGLILDLRNNPGGLLASAVDVSDAFLTKGKIVYTEGRNSGSKSEFRATKQTIIGDIPLIVIINGGSASASEIVAGALQDHGRAIIIGSKSFGKGSVQTIIPMAGGAGLKITTARYFTPKGRSIQAKGIIPDIKITPVTITETDNNLAKFRVSEKSLSGHLKNPSSATTEQKPSVKDKLLSSIKKDTKPKKSPPKLIKTDFVLYEALNLLKGIALLKNK